VKHFCRGSPGHADLFHPLGDPIHELVFQAIRLIDLSVSVGVFGNGRAPARCRQVARRRVDERGLPAVRGEVLDSPEI
jgi:hypothetical protein